MREVLVVVGDLALDSFESRGEIGLQQREREDGILRDNPFIDGTRVELLGVAPEDANRFQIDHLHVAKQACGFCFSGVFRMVGGGMGGEELGFELVIAGFHGLEREKEVGIPAMGLSKFAECAHGHSWHQILSFLLAQGVRGVRGGVDVSVWEAAAGSDRAGPGWGAR